MSDQPVDAETMRTLRHDIKNQLSGIYLALETMRYEITEPSEDLNFCLDTIFNAASKINGLLAEPE